MKNLKILFSPSENKTIDGIDKSLDLSSLLFADKDGVRFKLIEKYNALMTSGNEDLVCALTGLKKYNDAKAFCKSIYDLPLAPAIERYVGVAFDYLSYTSLAEKEKLFARENTLIFSNLFGAISAGDNIPTYKLKQGEKVDGINTASLYKKSFSKDLDELLKDKLIVDLRAGYYEKFYAPKSQVIGMKFLKNGKTVSHWAKAWRGLMLRSLAQVQPNTLEEIIDMQIEGVGLIDKIETKKKIELIYEIEGD